MKRSITRISYCITLLFVHSLQTGFERRYFHSLPTKLHEKVRLLLSDIQEGKKEKADLNKPFKWNDPEMPSPLNSIAVVGLAAEPDEESLRLMEQLLKAGADPNVATQSGDPQSALVLALKYGSSQGVKLLLEHGASVWEDSHMLKELSCTMEWSRAYESEEYRNEIMENVQLLLHYGADVNALVYDKSVYKPAFYYIIERYAQLTSSGKHRDCVLMLIKLFLRNGANPYITKMRLFSDGGILRERTMQNLIEYIRGKKLPEWAQYIVQGRRGYWAARVLFHGTKENESVCYGPFPPEITELIMRHFWNDL